MRLPRRRVGGTPLTDGERRDRHSRRRDRVDRILSLLALGCMAAFFVSGVFVVRSLKHDEKQRVTDLQHACLRTSVKTAADVNLNWVYYLSETELARQNGTGRVLKSLHLLSPGEQAFIRALIGTNSRRQPGRRILEVRAQADYNAAKIKAQTVDYHLIGLVHARTPLGSGAQPRRWVRLAHYDCTRIYGR